MRQVSQDRDWNSLTQAASFLYRLLIWIDDTPSLGVLELRRCPPPAGRIRPSQSRGPSRQRIGLIIVDYLQLMSGNQYTSSREQEISEIREG
jgi:replicative DNA helicase